MKQLLAALTVLTLLVPMTALAAGAPEVKRAVLCTVITDREPANQVATVPTGEPVLFFYNEIINGAGSTVSHRWLYNDTEMASVPLSIGADRWRTWSSKQIWHLLPGTLKVQVVDANGTVLAEQSVTITGKAGE